MAKIANRLFITSFILLVVVSPVILLITRAASTPRYDIRFQAALYLFPLIIMGMGRIKMRFTSTPSCLMPSLFGKRIHSHE